MQPPRHPSGCVLWIYFLPPFTAALSVAPALECGNLGGLDFDGCPRGGIATITCGTFMYLECAEADQRNVVPLLQGGVLEVVADAADTAYVTVAAAVAGEVAEAVVEFVNNGIADSEVETDSDENEVDAKPAAQKIQSCK